METFEIDVLPKSGSGWPLITKHKQANDPVRDVEGTLALDDEQLQELNGLSQLPQDYGVFLGRVLFRDRVRIAFDTALARRKERLRVLLTMRAKDRELTRLHWEWLCAPIDGRWLPLALDQRTPFSINIATAPERDFPSIGPRDLRALVLVACPQLACLAPFDVKATVQSLREALAAADIPCDVLAMADGTVVEGAIGPPTLRRLCRQLTDRKQRYTLLHIACHGKVADGETVLYWEPDADADRPRSWVKATALINQLGKVETLPHFIFLSTCESASPEAEGVMGGLAQRLVRELGLPAVVGMTGRIRIKTAQVLAEAFYRQLRASGEIDTALAEAAAGLQRHDISVPALFSRLGGQPLFRLPKGLVSNKKGQQATVNKGIQGNVSAENIVIFEKKGGKVYLTKPYSGGRQ